VSGGKDILTLTDGSVVDPVKLGTSQFAIRANLDTAQGSLQLTIDGSSTSFTGGPFISSESLFAPGIHTVTAAPQSGAAQSITFTVASGTRIIAGLRNDFAAHSPASGWSLEWNAAGAIGDALNHRQLYWSPSQPLYSADGSSTYPCTSTTDNAQLASRAGFFIGTSGACYVRPGRGTAFAGNVTDRFAVATYRVRTTGSYALVNSLVQSTTANGNGGQLRLYKESASGTMTALIAPTLIPASLTQGVTFDMALGTLAAGDILHICIGPNGNDASDEFEIDLNLQVTTP
jgi:hypothetical protein